MRWTGKRWLLPSISTLGAAAGGKEKSAIDEGSGTRDAKIAIKLGPMRIWRYEPTLEQLQERARGTLAEYIGIRLTEIGPDYLRATMPVNPHTHQPMGLLHG